VAQSMAATCHIYIGLKSLQLAGLDPVTFGQGKRLGKGCQLACHRLDLVIYMALYIFEFFYVYGWREARAGA
jgi:hypothetical protein